MVLDLARGTRSRTLPAQAGLSLVEVLVATFLLLLIVMGLVPLFARSAINNAMGADATQISNQAKSRLDSVLNSGFNGPMMTIPDGEDELVTVEYWDPELDAFTAVVPDDLNTVRWRRTTTVRQYGADALDDGAIVSEGANSDTLPGGTDVAFVKLKEIEVVVVSFPGRGGAGGIPGRRIVAKTLVGD